MQRILFIINPFSGNKTGEQIIEIINNKFNKYFPNISYEIYITNPDESTIHLKNHYDLIIAVGGDGTASIAIKSIIQNNNKAAFSLIPIGVGNDLAREFGLYINFSKRKLEKQLFYLLKIILLNGKKSTFDVFSINGIQMINYFSIGYDAYVLHKFDFYRKKLNKFIFSNFQNKLLYLFLGIIFFYKKLPKQVEIISDNINLLFCNPIKNIIITNINNYASGSKISNKTKTNDNFFEFIVIRTLFDYILLMLTRTNSKILLSILSKKITRIKAKELIIKPGTSIPAQIDGEAIIIKDKEIKITLLGQITIIKRRR